MKESFINRLKQTNLGKQVQMPQSYSANILEPIPRDSSLKTIHYGKDIWNAYELYFLTKNNVPRVVMMTCEYPSSTPYIVESKSFKFYLNTFCELTFSSTEEVCKKIEEDISKKIQGSVSVTLTELTEDRPSSVIQDAQYIDESITHMKTTSSWIEDETLVSETLFTHAFRSLCPITSQPDYATIILKYTGKKICHQALMNYIVSFKHHQGFHEQCVELIYEEILEKARCQSLCVQGLFTRRGGLDINPIRSSHKIDSVYPRQYRQ